MSAPTTTLRSVRGRVGDALLTVAAVGGALCILLVVIAAVFNITLIMFATGSMSPTIPAGSLAVVKQIPASEVQVGDIVTVDRVDALPITHRVTSVSAAADNDARSITMRGDANELADPAPYIVTSARIVLFSVPQLAYAVTAISSPLVLGLITLAATTLVTWAFWPRDEVPPRRRQGKSHEDRSPQDDSGQHWPRHDTDGQRAGRHRVPAGPLALLALAAVANPLWGVVPSAQAAETESVIEGTALSLTSIGDGALMAQLRPTVPVPWQVGVVPHAAEPGIVHLSLASEGGLAMDPNGVQVTVSSCAVRWIDGVCAQGGAVILGPGPVSTLVADSVELGSMPTDRELWILIDVSVPANPANVRGESATLTFTADGVGDAVSTGGTVGAIAMTGTDLRTPFVAALIAVLTGLGLAGVARLLKARQRASRKLQGSDGGDDALRVRAAESH
ncbi:signal peptidase I [Salinibacterium sp. NK8237]|uniref:signal peptidase I n=1 Tax=Salinibacterium sp. NK8237 TaxID=2792038 RepID=UPI0018CF1D4A|nr:signal peptidase I [Salinibacterium sp. NK8237]MBH0130594.1 signal peptidase I [Salinibacterium sp. NK8237]